MSAEELDKIDRKHLLEAELLRLEPLKCRLMCKKDLGARMAFKADAFVSAAEVETVNKRSYPTSLDTNEYSKLIETSYLEGKGPCTVSVKETEDKHPAINDDLTEKKNMRADSKLHTLKILNESIDQRQEIGGAQPPSFSEWMTVSKSSSRGVSARAKMPVRRQSDVGCSDKVSNMSKEKLSASAQSTFAAVDGATKRSSVTLAGFIPNLSPATICDTPHNSAPHVSISSCPWAARSSSCEDKGVSRAFITTSTVSLRDIQSQEEEDRKNSQMQSGTGNRWFIERRPRMNSFEEVMRIQKEEAAEKERLKREQLQEEEELRVVLKQIRDQELSEKDKNDFAARRNSRKKYRGRPNKITSV